MAVEGSVRVLHVIDSLSGGGSERWVWEIVRLAHRDRVCHRVTTVFPESGRFVYANRLRELGAYGRGGQSGRGDAETAGALATFAARVPRRVKRPVEPFWHFGVVFPLALYRVFRDYVLFRPEVLHAHTFYGFVYGLLLQKIGGRPLIHTVPALFSQMADAGYTWMPGLYRRFQGRVRRFFTAYPDELLTLGIPAEKVSRIEGGVDLEATDEARSLVHRHRIEVRKDLAIPDDGFIALSVGRLHSSKGHEYVLEAMPTLLRYFPGLHWIVLGDGPERGNLRQRSQELGVDGSVHFVGFVEAPLRWYAAADIYFRTGLFEGENLSSYNAMAVGLPTVGFDTGCRTDLIARSGHGVLVPPKDAGALAEAAISTLKSRGRRQAMGEAGAAYAHDHLGISNVISAFEVGYVNFRAGAAATSEEMARRSSP